MTDRDAAAPEGVGVPDLPEVSMHTVTEPTDRPAAPDREEASLDRRAAGRRAAGARRRRVRGGA